MHDNRVFVIGTTPDYVAKLHRKYGKETAFVLDSRFKGNPDLAAVDQSPIVFSPLEDFEGTLQSLSRYLSRNKLSAKGIACFDCESLILSSWLSSRLGKPFPSCEAIIHARNKLHARKAWQEAGLTSPNAILAGGLAETVDFFRTLRRDLVLKPLSGSGSELVFHCRSEAEIHDSVTIMMAELSKRKSNPLFRPIPGTAFATPIDPCRWWIAEEFVLGPEFSSEFFLQDGNVTFVRDTGKLKAPGQTFGSILAYTFPAPYPDWISRQALAHCFKEAANALGFTWGHFMVDFILRDTTVVLIELTPRPGGDSIPDLIETATGVDPLGIHLDFVSRKTPFFQPIPIPSRCFASVHFFAPGEGILTHLDLSHIQFLPCVKAIFLKKRTGDRITLPPADYDNRILAYCIVSLEHWRDLPALCRQLQELLRVSIVPEDSRTQGMEPPTTEDRDFP